MSPPKQRDLFADAERSSGEMPWERAAAEDLRTAEIVFPLPVETVFHYLIPDELRDCLAAGERVRVPFGRGDRLTVGYCVGTGPAPKSERALKRVESLIDRQPLLSPKMLQLTRWMADYYLCTWGQVLDAVVPAGVKRKAGTREQNVFFLSARGKKQLDSLLSSSGKSAAAKLPAKQFAVLQFLAQSEEPVTAQEISDAVGCGSSPIQALRKRGLIEAIRERRSTGASEKTVSLPHSPEQPKRLNAAQQKAVETVLQTLRNQEHRCFVLHGVTSSGKTEVYLQVAAEVVSYGRQVIVLVPEISLTPQTIRRFRSRFSSVAVLHSHLSDAERHHYWQQIAEGKVQVVVGARSAVFAPAPQLGLIVIDEEHETSFKQESVPRYHAREVARERARLENVPLILGSATPTLETWQRVQQGEDCLLELPQRVGALPMPPVIVVDVRNDPHITRGAAIGRALHAAMKNELQRGGQIILFLNLRGFSPTLWCRACGTGVKCPHCDITLTWHRDRNIVLCHSCDYRTAALTHCPQCGHAGLRYFGIGTQRLEEEVKARFAGVPLLRMDSDSMRKPGSHDAALEAFRHGEVQILLGTQMIAKGLDFPNVTLVGVINADTVLHQPDFRAAERTFQLIAQVAGRTGRSRKGGRVFVQTCFPTEPAIVQAARHNYHGFATLELEHRRELQYPPFRKLVRVILRGPREEEVSASAHTLAELLREKAGGDVPLHLLGPAPAPVVRLRGLFRYHFQIAADDLQPVRRLWKDALQSFRPPREVEYVVDVEPLNMM